MGPAASDALALAKQVYMALPTTEIGEYTTSGGLYWTKRELGDDYS